MNLFYNIEHYPDPTAGDAIRNIQQSLPLHYIIQGDPRTKKNSPQILYRGRQCPLCHKRQTPFVSPSKAYREYEQQALWQLTPKPKQPISRSVTVKCLFYMKTKRDVDLTNLLEAACDILVAGRILADDNSRIAASHDGSRVLYDKNHPRMEIFIEELSE